MFKIGEFSKLSNITVRSLRHYESLGLLEPEKTDTTTGYRYYSARQLETAKKIRMFRDLGFSLESIRGLLNAGNLNAMRQYYELRQIELEDELQSIRQRKDKLSLLLNNIEENGNIDCYNALEKEFP
jgi:DNA-binding transcriptional MerR regulator